MFIRSKRLFLRPAWLEDAHDLQAAISDERIVRNLARVPWPYRLQDARAFVVTLPERGYPSLLITMPDAEGSSLIGGIGLHEEAGRAELGYWLVPSAWERGYATEAARALLSVAPMLGHVRIGARHFVDNPASGRVLEKLGFHRTGDIGDRHRLGRAGTALSCEYMLRLDGSADGQPASADLSSNQPGARSGVMSSTRKWSTARPSAG
jgi:RimJ/RimL family protein N-acetyltransferase